MNYFIVEQKEFTPRGAHLLRKVTMAFFTEIETDFNALSAIDIVELFGIAIMGAGILETFLTFIYLPFVKNAARNFDPAPPIIEDVKSNPESESPPKRTDISEMYNKMGRYLSEVRRLMRQSQDYNKTLEEFHKLPSPPEGIKRSLHMRAKRMMLHYQNTPQILSMYADTFEHVMNQMTQLLESADDMRQNVITSHAKSEHNIVTLEKYILNGSLIEFLRHLAAQYQVKAEWVKDLNLRLKANVWQDFKNVPLSTDAPKSKSSIREVKGTIAEKHDAPNLSVPSPMCDDKSRSVHQNHGDTPINGNSGARVGFTSRDEVLSFNPTTSYNQSELTDSNIPSTAASKNAKDRSYFVRRRPQKQHKDMPGAEDLSSENGEHLSLEDYPPLSHTELSKNTSSQQLLSLSKEAWLEKIADLEKTLDEKTKDVDEARKKHQQLKAKLVLWRKVYIDFQRNCLTHHAPKEQPKKGGCGSRRRVTLCQLDDIYQPELYAQEKLKLPTLEMISRSLQKDAARKSIVTGGTTSVRN